jgi:hypothetical protein
MSALFRRRVENAIEQMILILDDLDGDPDFESEPIEEQHDREEEGTVTGREMASILFVLAKKSQKQV